jgi:hypothetical protein
MKFWKLSVLFFVLVGGSSIYFWQNQNMGKWQKTVQSDSKTIGTNSNFTRTLASSESGKLIQAINEKIVSIKHKSEILPLIEEINEIADKKENSSNYTLQLYRAVLTPVKLLEGVVWRLRGVVEKSGVLHMQAINVIQKLYYMDYLYGPHVIAIVDFLVEPSVKETKFMKPSSFQDFMETKLKPELEKSLAQVESILSKTDSSWNFVWDAHLVTGYDKDSGKVFISEAKRFKRSITRSYVNFIASNLHRLIGAIEYSTNYNVEQITNIVNAVVKETAINSLKQKFRLKSLPESTTPLQVIAIVNSISKKRVQGRNSSILRRNVTVKTYAEFLTLRKSEEVASKNLQSSMKHFHTARKLELAGFKESIDQADHSQGDRYMLNPNILKINREETEQRLQDIISLYESGIAGQSKIVTSDVTGQQLEVNLSALFTPHNDLKMFLPTVKTGFDKSVTRGGIIRDNNNKKIKHEKTKGTIFAWNYKYGLPIAWENPTFGGFLPNATSENMYSIARTMQLTDSLSNFKSFLPIP